MYRTSILSTGEPVEIEFDSVIQHVDPAARRPATAIGCISRPASSISR